MRILKNLKLKDISYKKVLLIIITSSSMEKALMIDSDINQYEELRKLTAGQDENCTTGCLLRLWLYQKSLQTNRSWFECTKRIRCWSKIDSANRIC